MPVSRYQGEVLTSAVAHNSPTAIQGSAEFVYTVSLY